MMTQSELADVQLVADGLAFPEGPVALSDGSLLVVEIHRGTVTRIRPGHPPEVVASCGGGPNGAAVGPDGALYVCNNGGRWPAYEGGRIERVDVGTGQVDVLYDRHDGRPLPGPNDLVFDASGNLWFTATGKFRDHDRDFGAVYHASPSGDRLVQVIGRLDAPNGVGLSPDGATLYYAESITGRVYRRSVIGPGQLAPVPRNDPDTLLCGLPGLHMLDSLAIDADGRVCVGTLISGRISVIEPDGSRVHQYRLPAPYHDPMPTNICFGGADHQMAYITLSETGRVVSCPWPAAGLPLAFNR